MKKLNQSNLIVFSPGPGEPKDYPKSNSIYLQLKGKKKILFVSQEITPYLPETYMSNIGLNLPKHSIELGNETRVFLPKFGVIKEKTNNLHEVIRLSGMNLILDDFDHQLIIKLASIQSARMQI